MEHLTTPLEIKFAGNDGDDMTIKGYGSVFGNVDGHGDVVSKGAFASTLREAKSTGRWPLMLAQHGGFLSAQDMMPIGVWTDMREDDKGLLVEGKLAATPRGQEAYQLLKMAPRPALDGLSIGYRVKQSVRGTKPGEPRRTLTEVDLVEVSLVSTPSNPKARITSVKSLDCRALEQALVAELNLSRGNAVSAIALMKKHLREEGEIAADDGREGQEFAQIAAALRRNIANART